MSEARPSLGRPGVGVADLGLEATSRTNFDEFVILLMGQHKYDVTLSDNCLTCALRGQERAYPDRAVEVVDVVKPADHAVPQSENTERGVGVGRRVRAQLGQL